MMLALWASMALGTLFAASAEAAVRVEVELSVAPDFPASRLQQWARLLNESDFDRVRIDLNGSNGRPRTESLGNDTARIYKVHGVLISSGHLLLPDGKFTLQQGGQIADWVKALRVDGPDGKLRGEAPFGLLPKELEQVRKALSAEVAFTGEDLNRSEVIQRLVASLEMPVLQPRASADHSAREDHLASPLRGLSTGTALAYALRGSGQIVRPQRSGNTVRLFISKASRDAEAWPVGYPAEQQRRTLLPTLFEMTEVEITNVPLGDALSAIAQKLEVPLLMDEAALQQMDLDPAKHPVSLPEARLSYSLILRKLLSSARMKSELRIDDAKRPFLWVTSLRPPK
jgi:hypothetical protein